MSDSEDDHSEASAAATAMEVDKKKKPAAATPTRAPAVRSVTYTQTQLDAMETTKKAVFPKPGCKSKRRELMANASEENPAPTLASMFAHESFDPNLDIACLRNKNGDILWVTPLITAAESEKKTDDTVLWRSITPPMARSCKAIEAWLKDKHKSGALAAGSELEVMDIKGLLLPEDIREHVLSKKTVRSRAKAAAKPAAPAAAAEVSASPVPAAAAKKAGTKRSAADDTLSSGNKRVAETLASTAKVPASATPAPAAPGEASLLNAVLGSLPSTKENMSLLDYLIFVGLKSVANPALWEKNKRSIADISTAEEHAALLSSTIDARKHSINACKEVYKGLLFPGQEKEVSQQSKIALATSLQIATRTAALYEAAIAAQPDFAADNARLRTDTATLSIELEQVRKQLEEAQEEIEKLKKRPTAPAKAAVTQRVVVVDQSEDSDEVNWDE